MKKILLSSPYIAGFLILLSAGAMINAKPVNDKAAAGQTLSTSSTSGINAYPNPFNQVLNVKFTAKAHRQVTVSLVSLTDGTTALREVHENLGQPLAINTTNVPNGPYTVTVRLNDATATMIGSAQVQCSH